MSSSGFNLVKKVYGIGTAKKPSIMAPPFSSAQANLTVRDEGVVQNSQTKEIDFVGEGVSAVKDPVTGKVTVRVDAVSSGGGASGLEFKLNNSGATISKFAPVSELPNGSIALCDASTPTGEVFFGIAVESIPNGSSGPVQIEGDVAGALAGYGFAVEEAVYVTTTPGLLGNRFSVPTASGSLVYRAGYASGAGAVNLLIDKQKIVRN